MRVQLKACNNRRAKGKKTKAQSALEYMTIIGIAFVLIIPAVMIFFNYSKTTTDQTTAAQLNLIGNQILSASEEMHVLGPGSWVTLDINFPDALKNASVENDGKDLVFVYYSNEGESYSVNFAQQFEMFTGGAQCKDSSGCGLNVTAGKNTMRIESLGSGKIWLRANI